ncbi:MAG TPA: hypothetical protein VD866_19055 [Urbifossiella sp.]|nr:hypothetical protein [Urbifossiella sp.]
MPEKKTLKLEIHEMKDTGECVLTGRTNLPVLVVSTDDGFLSEAAISLKGLQQLVKMKLNGKTKPVDGGE